MEFCKEEKQVPLAVLAPRQQECCDLCGLNLPEIQSSSLGVAAVRLPSVYTLDGIALGLLCHRRCNGCAATYYTTYVKAADGGQWVYDNFASQRYFAATSSRVYEMALLREQEQAFVHMAAPFNAYADKYNEQHVHM